MEGEETRNDFPSVVAHLRVEDLRSDKPTEARRLGKNIIVWRDLDGRLVCQDARCPHKGAHLGDGRLRGASVECPYHGFRFETDGACVSRPSGARAASRSRCEWRTIPSGNAVARSGCGGETTGTRPVCPRSTSRPRSPTCRCSTRRTRGPNRCTTPVTSRVCWSSTTSPGCTGVTGSTT
ncbi:Rieske (2Fe-2S) protein [Streptomyces oceani]|uniref:Rieske (2Fe-2S) protein n=1 Tax=Streptomyces oceani TaxID=1075402 RepID=UPI0009A12352|nr:Rieske (2Fe-2S) protein [Streptomyces oceani]